MGKNIGIITDHSAYNFGSVLQAYATEKALEYLGYNAQILYYRMQSQYLCLYHPDDCNCVTYQFSVCCER